MKPPSTRVLGLTWVGWLNITMLQWFFVRLSYGARWRMLTGIVPLSGWWNRYRTILPHRDRFEP